MIRRTTIFIGLMILIFPVLLYAQLPKKSAGNLTNGYRQPDGRVYRSMITVSNLAVWIDHDGRSAHTPGDDAGGFYPRETAGVIYIDGPVWAGYVRDDNPQNPRLNGSMYNVGTTPGRILPSGVTQDRNHPEVRLYRIRKDYLNLSVDELRREAAYLNEIQADEITGEQMQEIQNQYIADWQNWPAHIGAPFYDLNGNDIYEPETGETPGLAGADQVIWFVLNDLNMSATFGFAASYPIGLEIQVTLWAYNLVENPLGQAVFRRYRLINKSGVQLDSMYFGLWSDPDVGTYTDDLCGCDSSLNLAYGYSGFVTDGQFMNYGLYPSSIGYALLQGPIIRAPQHSAIFNFKKRIDHKNLKATSFVNLSGYYWYQDVPLADYDNTLRYYNVLRGYIPTVDINNPTPIVFQSGPEKGKETKFPLSGDPFRGSGDVDGQEGNLQPGDRRFMLSTGPFFMIPGDTQEVVDARVGGLGSPLKYYSVELLKENVSYIRGQYPDFEVIRNIPPAPSVNAYSRNGRIILEWGSDLATVNAIESEKDGSFQFEGYQVWQFPSAGAPKDSAVCIAVFDKETAPAAIIGKTYDPKKGILVDEVLVAGTNNGIDHYITLYRDTFSGRSFIDGKTYYFAVSAYSCDHTGRMYYPVIESELCRASVIAQKNNPGYAAQTGDVLRVSHSGSSDGQVDVMVVNPDLLTGHDYEIFFTPPAQDSLVILSNLLWNVRDITTGQILLQNQQQLPPGSDQRTQPVIDGLRISVNTQEPGFKAFMVVANANGPVDPPEQGCFAFNNNGFPFLNGSDRPDGSRQQTNGSTWGINQSQPGNPNYSNFVSRVTQYSGGFGEPDPVGLAFLIPRDYEIRFTGTPAPALYLWTEPTPPNQVFMGTVPFELWCIGDSENPSDDYRCFPWIFDEDRSSTFNLLDLDHSVSGGNNDPFTDGICWIEPISRDLAGYESLVATHVADPEGAEAESLWVYKKSNGPWNSVPGMARMVFVNWNGGDVTSGVYDAEMPEEGTVFRILTTKPNTLDDVFSFTAPAQPDVPNSFRIYQNYPNPFNLSTTFRFWIPRRDQVELSVYDILGRRVATLVDGVLDQGEYFRRWDTNNLSSGLYIYRLKSGGREARGKMVLVK